MSPSRQIPTSGAMLHVLDEGSGSPVLMLHGFPDSSRLWRNQIPALTAAGFRAIAPDLRGFGESDRPPRVRDYTMPKIIDDLRRVMDASNVERAAVVGHDWGAITAWSLAAWEPDRVERLVAVSVGHPRSYVRAALTSTQAIRSLYALFFQLPVVAEATIRARNWALFRRGFGASPDFEQYVADLSRPGALSAALNWYRANGRIGALTRCPRIRVPTLGIIGSKDAALGMAQMTGSGRYIDAEWRYEVLNGGHWLPLSRSEELNRLLLDFLAPAARRGTARS
jgi:pimeloyl-ACP methyl ester carboxylesterase